jgi:transposase
MRKISTVQAIRNEILKEQKLTIGVDLGDRWSFYCVLDEAGKIILEQKVAMTPEAMKQTFGKIPRSLIAMETGTHSPWMSRLLRELGHQGTTPPVEVCFRNRDRTRFELRHLRWGLSSLVGIQE